MDRELRIRLAIVAVLTASAAGPLSGQHDPAHPSVEAALRHFESAQARHLDAFLGPLRRPAPSPTLRAMVIRTLPKEGALVPSPQDAAKLAGIRPVLALHGREQDMELRLIALGGMASLGLHARTVLLISKEALDLFEADELLAIMAHELGHDYVWDEYEQARRGRDHRRLQELELLCDGIAVMTMHRLGMEPERLVSAATKVVRHNERMMGPSRDARYVPLDQRVRFIRHVARLTAHSAPAR